MLLFFLLRTLVDTNDNKKRILVILMFYYKAVERSTFSTLASKLYKFSMYQSVNHFEVC